MPEEGERTSMPEPTEPVREGRPDTPTPGPDSSAVVNAGSLEDLAATPARTDVPTPATAEGDVIPTVDVPPAPVHEGEDASPSDTTDSHGEAEPGEEHPHLTPDEARVVAENFDAKLTESGVRDQYNELKDIMSKPPGERTQADAARVLELSRDLATAYQTDPELAALLEPELRSVMGDRIYDNYFAQNADRGTEGEEPLTEEDERALEERVRGLNREMDDYRSNPTAEKWEKIQREIDDIGDHHLLEQIKKSHGWRAKTLYYAFMTFIVLFYVTALTTKVVSSAAAGGGRH